jgi:hypothetical protein
MILTDYATESHWELWSLIKSKSNALRQREREFYRQYKETALRATSEDDSQGLLPWKKLVKYQSFPVYFDEKLHPKRLHPVWPKQVQHLVFDSKTRSMKRVFEDTDSQYIGISKRRRLLQVGDETQLENGNVEFAQTVNGFNAPDEYNGIVTDLTEDAELQQAAYKAQETARKAKIDAEIDIDKALYLEYKGHIEYVWRMFPGKSKNAPRWEKMGEWKNWLRNAGKSIPTPSEARLREARMCAEPVVKSTTSSVLSVTESASIGDVRYVVLEPGVGDYEDPKDDSTWYKFPDSEYRFLCGHWKDRCRERKCSPKDSNHVCCHVGLSREKKLASLRRPEYRRKGTKN